MKKQQLSIADVIALNSAFGQDAQRRQQLELQTAQLQQLAASLGIATGADQLGRSGEKFDLEKRRAESEIASEGGKRDYYAAGAESARAGARHETAQTDEFLAGGPDRAAIRGLQVKKGQAAEAYRPVQQKMAAAESEAKIGANAAQIRESDARAGTANTEGALLKLGALKQLYDHVAGSLGGSPDAAAMLPKLNEAVLNIVQMPEFAEVMRQIKSSKEGRVQQATQDATNGGMRPGVDTPSNAARSGNWGAGAMIR